MGLRAAWHALWGRKQSAVGSILAATRIGQPVRMADSYEAFAREAYDGNVVARRCISLVARSVASVDLLVMRGETETPESPLAKLLRAPNPWQAGASFFEAIVAYYLIAGDAFMEAVGPSETAPPGELYAHRPDRVEVIVGDTGGPIAYRYTASGGSHRFPVDPLTGASAITHWRSFNPLNEWRGRSPISAGGLSIDLHNEAGKWNLALTQNGAKPPGALVYKGDAELQPAQIDDLRGDLERMMTGSKNAGRPPILSGDFDWKQFGFSPTDMDWLEGRNTSAREIASVFGVPAMLIGIAGDNTYANFAEARLSLWEDTVLPLLDSLLDEINRCIAPRFGDFRVLYDADSIYALAPRRAETWARVQQADFLTPNEKRLAVGYDEIDGGDKLLVPATMLPVDFDPASVSEDGMKAWLIASGYERKEAERVASLAFRGDAP